MVRRMRGDGDDVPNFLGRQCGAKNNHKVTRRFLTKKDKTTLEVYRDSYVQSADNYPSTKSKVPKIGNNLKSISSNPFYKVIPKT